MTLYLIKLHNNLQIPLAYSNKSRIFATLLQKATRLDHSSAGRAQTLLMLGSWVRAPSGSQKRWTEMDSKQLLLQYLIL